MLDSHLSVFAVAWLEAWEATAITSSPHNMNNCSTGVLKSTFMLYYFDNCEQ